jgi:N-acetylmuramic acid 6-phosphate (MurNAc-6-P) etherase
VRPEVVVATWVEDGLLLVVLASGVVEAAEMPPTFGTSPASTAGPCSPSQIAVASGASASTK